VEVVEEILVGGLVRLNLVPIGMTGSIEQFRRADFAGAIDGDQLPHLGGIGVEADNDIFEGGWWWGRS
jgi:hypothetical protein